MVTRLQEPRTAPPAADGRAQRRGHLGWPRRNSAGSAGLVGRALLKCRQGTLLPESWVEPLGDRELAGVRSDVPPGSGHDELCGLVEEVLGHSATVRTAT